MGKLTWNVVKKELNSLKANAQNSKKKSRPSPTNLRTPKPEPNSPRRPSSSLKRTSTNLKIASTPKNAKSELSQKTWTILFKELEIYKSFTCSHDQLYKRVLYKCSCVWKVLLC